MIAGIESPQTPPGVRYSSDRDRHLMMPSPPMQQPTDARHSGWLSAGTAPAYCSSINRPAVTPPTLFGNARYARSARHPQPSCDARRLGRALWPNLAQPAPRLNPHRARGTDGALPPAISCLGACQTPAARARRGLVIAGVRKPAQIRTWLILAVDVRTPARLRLLPRPVSWNSSGFGSSNRSATTYAQTWPAWTKLNVPIVRQSIAGSPSTTSS